MKKLIFIILLLSLTLIGCEKEVIRIGVVTTLSGNNSDIGVSMRDGFLLKVNEINDAGGINGHKIELIIKDDEGDINKVKQITQDLIDQDIKILFGYETSSKKNAIEEFFGREDLIFMSPTLSAYELSNIDDNFFRVIPTNYQQGETLGHYANKYSKKTLVLYSQVNANFAKGVYEGYADTFEGEVVIKAVEKGILELEEDILLWYEGMDSLMVVMNPNDTLLTSQVFYRNNVETNIYSSNWGMAANAHQTGGQSIDGTVYTSLLGDDSYAPYKRFQETYFDRFNENPSFATIYAYEAGIIITEALKQADSFDGQDLKKAILELDVQEGIISDLKLNEFGDIQRENLIVKLIEGKLIYQE